MITATFPPNFKRCYEEIDAVSVVDKPYDYVSHPPHYTRGTVECIDAIQASLTPEEFAGYCKGNALKYIWREKHKGGSESLQKAQWYLTRLIERGTR